MARTSKSRGIKSFQMRSGNSPNKFLRGLGKKISKTVGNVASKVMGGGGGSSRTPEEQRALVDQMVADSGARARMGGGFGSFARLPLTGGSVFGGGGVNLPGGGPMTKKKKVGFTPYKASYCKSPLRKDFLSYGLDKGQYDATSGKGTVKYGNIAKSRAFANISHSIADTVNRIEAGRTPTLRDQKRDWKKSQKFNKWLNRKRKGWKD